MVNTKTLLPYKTMPVWTAQSIPKAFLEKHNTKEGTWAKLTILSGSLVFYQLSPDGEEISRHIFDASSDIPFVDPQVWHKVSPNSPDLSCYLTFYCQKEDYFHKKYGLTRTHSEVIASAPLLSEKSNILDLGCGQGRNSLYLSLLGHQVTSVDSNGQSLVALENMALEEELPYNIKRYDINTTAIEGHYDFILSTVVFMFLNPDCISDIILQMQSHTQIGGYNLIVSAMDTTENPCPLPFPFTFKEGQLKSYYNDWEIIKYNENLGELHRVDENGNRLKLQFATLLARKLRS